LLKDCNCGALSRERVGEKVTLAGWVHRRRDHGGMVFIDLRDRDGITQVVFNPRISREAYDVATSLRNEFVVQVTGEVVLRPAGTENLKLSTGEIEVTAVKAVVLNESLTPPFYINEDVEVEESLYLKNRYLYLRRPRMKDNLILRHRITKFMSDFLDAFSRTNLSDLRRSVSSGTAENNAEIVSGVYLSWDDEDTGVAIEYDSPDWASLTLDYKVPSAPRWLSLNLDLARGTIAVGDTIGLVVEGYAPQTVSIKPRLRSGIDGEIYDSNWDETIELHPANDVAVALRTFTVIDGIGDLEGYHTLVLDLPGTDSALTIRNMRLFCLPSGCDLPKEPETLSSFAV